MTGAQVQVYKHEASGIQVWCQALQLSPEDSEPGNCMLFHYTSEATFQAITTSAKIGPDLWASLKQETTLGGRGVFASGQEPADLADNLPEELPQGAAAAPFCLPMIVPKAIAYDVCPAGPRFQNVDIWVIHCDGEAREASTLENISSGMLRRFSCILEARQAHLGIDHTDTLDSFSYLAYLLDANGKCAEAEKLYRQALRGYSAVLGSDHPDTLRTMNNLAVLLYALGNVEEAEPLSRTYLHGCEARLGPNHADTLASMNNHACLLQARGRIDEAVELFQGILERQQAHLGSEHPKTLGTALKYVLFLRSCSRLEEAEQLCQQTYQKCNLKFGIGHSLTLQAASSLAALFGSQGRPLEAANLLRQVCAEREIHLGFGHPTTLRSHCSLAASLTAAGQAGEAEVLWRQVLHERNEKLGPDHGDVRECLDGLAEALRAQGLLPEADGRRQPPEKEQRQAEGGIDSTMQASQAEAAPAKLLPEQEVAATTQPREATPPAATTLGLPSSLPDTPPRRSAASCWGALVLSICGKG